MRYALTAAEMREVEESAIAEGRLTVAGLMERAGAAVAAVVLERVPAGPVCVVCGPGNNGGDGWVAARRLAEAGRVVWVVALRDPGALAGEARDAAESAMASGVEVRVLDGACRIDGLLDGAGVIVDAVFGFGLQGGVREPYAAALRAIATSGAYVVSADVPSGVDPDTGGVAGAAVRADVTVTFTALKPGLLLQSGAALAGEVIVADIGVPLALNAPAGSLVVPDAADMARIVPWPRPDDHKGSRGRVAIVAGSNAYHGAAVLATAGALRMGVGYAIAVCPKPVAVSVRAAWPNAIVVPVKAASDGSFADAGAVLEALAGADAVVVGPGLTMAEGPRSVVRSVVADVRVPIVIDADALNILADEAALLDARDAPCIITPHPGEAARLLRIETAAVNADRPASARRLAAPGRVAVLKGPGTVVAGGGRSALVTAGGPALARAGSGDVLSGMLGALLAQGVDPFDAALLGAHLHGRAADHGARALTALCFTATDIVRFLPDAVGELGGG